MAKVDVYGHTRMMIALVVVATLLPLSMLGQYRLIIRPVDKDSAFVQQNLRLQQSFRNKDLCREYVGNLPVLLRSKGYAAASIDSVLYDSLSATVSLYVGESFSYVKLNIDSIDKKLLDAIAWKKK